MKGNRVSLDCDALYDVLCLRSDVFVDQKEGGVDAGLRQCFGDRCPVRFGPSSNVR
jgi:hypothetical protein